MSWSFKRPIWTLVAKESTQSLAPESRVVGELTSGKHQIGPIGSGSSDGLAWPAGTWPPNGVQFGSGAGMDDCACELTAVKIADGTGPRAVATTAVATTSEI